MPGDFLRERGLIFARVREITLVLQTLLPRHTAPAPSSQSTILSSCAAAAHGVMTRRRATSIPLKYGMVSWDVTDELAVKMWDKILQSGRRITGIASTDSHRPDAPIGKPTTHVAARVLSQRSLLQGIRQGHVFLTDGTDRVVLNFEAERTERLAPRAGGIGDEIPLLAPGKVRFIVTTPVAPPDATVSLISNGEVIRSFPAKKLVHRK